MGQTGAHLFTSMSRGTGFARPQAGGPLGGQGATWSERPWGPCYTHGLRLAAPL